MTTTYKSYLLSLLFFIVMAILPCIVGVDFIVATGMSWLASIFVFFFFDCFYFDE